MRSLLIAIYQLGVNEIMIIGHSDCGVQHLDSTSMIDKMISRGVTKQTIRDI